MVDETEDLTRGETWQCFVIQVCADREITGTCPQSHGAQLLPQIFLLRFHKNYMDGTEVPRLIMVLVVFDVWHWHLCNPSNNFALNSDIGPFGSIAVRIRLL